MKQMRMLVQTAPGKLEIQQVACPQPGPGEILMRVHYCGICGTDLMNYRGQYVWGRDSFPKFPGHEASGVVEALGEGVNHFKIGDRILPECTIGCGVCEWCKAGNYSLCRNRMKTSNGAMADYLTVPAKGVLELPRQPGAARGGLDRTGSGRRQCGSEMWKYFREIGGCHRCGNHRIRISGNLPCPGCGEILCL
ncbi:MAG: alcohol dehydrogenase catalytic domain-containing protein [Candidatus Omnitrophica bacterium]|nr:alcohol dehydrogenase catalytic domain-containing protein [Candidatus Omnitrophota bacterium]